MSFILVSADFPDVDSTKREAVYKCLQQSGWLKVSGPGRDLSTTWYKEFTGGTSESPALNITIGDFTACASPCKPRLSMQWGPNRPVFHNMNQ